MNQESENGSKILFHNVIFLIPVRVAIIKKTIKQTKGNTCEEKVIFRCCLWEC
jgi:hypothetical protein